MENEKLENVVEETTQAQENDSTVESMQEKAEEKSQNFTQDQVNEMIRERLERSNNSFYKRYGVNDRDGLDSLIGKAQSYDIMKERYEEMNNLLNDTKQELAFVRNNINAERVEDIKAHFKGKELELTEENLIQELATHPEWLKVAEKDTAPKTTIQTLSVDHKDNNSPEGEQEKMKRIFGV